MSEDYISTSWAIIKGGLRSIAASWPVCASIGQAWNEYETHRTGQRIQEFMDNFRRELDEFQKEDALREETIAQIAEQVPSLIEIAIEKVRREFDEEKRRVYARALAHAVSIGIDISYSAKLSVLHDLDTLTTADLRVLLLFQDKKETSVADLNWRELNLEGDTDEQLESLAGHLGKLESRGLILVVSPPPSAFHMPPDLSLWAARWLQTGYRLLPPGRNIIGAISE